MAQSRIKILAKMDILPEIRNDPQFHMEFPPAEYVAGPIIQLSGVSFGYDPKKFLLSDISFSVDINTKAALVGNNGIGKVTQQIRCFIPFMML